MSLGEPRSRFAVTGNGVFIVSFAVILLSIMPVAVTAAPQNQGVLQITEPSSSLLKNTDSLQL
jgi:hypothetical protein